MIIALATTLVGSAGPATAADPLDEVLAQLGPGHGAIERVLVEAQRSGLPVTRLAAKTREGVAKRIPPERLAAYLSRLSQALQESRALAPTGLAHDAAVVEAVARSLMAGIPAGELSRRLTLEPDSSASVVAAARLRAVQLATLLADLRGRRVPVMRTLALADALDAADEGALDAATVGALLFSMTKVGGMSWHSAADELTEAMKKGGSFGQAVSTLASRGRRVGAGASHEPPPGLQKKADKRLKSNGNANGSGPPAAPPGKARGRDK